MCRINFYRARGKKSIWMKNKKNFQTNYNGLLLYILHYIILQRRITGYRQCVAYKWYACMTEFLLHSFSVSILFVAFFFSLVACREKTVLSNEPHVAHSCWLHTRYNTPFLNFVGSSSIFFPLAVVSLFCDYYFISPVFFLSFFRNFSYSIAALVVSLQYTIIFHIFFHHCQTRQKLCIHMQHNF